MLDDLGRVFMAQGIPRSNSAANSDDWDVRHAQNLSALCKMSDVSVGKKDWGKKAFPNMDLIKITNKGRGGELALRQGGDALDRKLRHIRSKYRTRDVVIETQNRIVFHPRVPLQYPV